MQLKIRVWEKNRKEWVNPHCCATIFEEGEIKVQDKQRFEMVVSTNLKDKNGKEIYEGDIVQNIGMPEYQRVGIVEFEGGKFIVIPIKFIKDKKYKGDLYYWDEVIGNIYENPELLEEKK